jgi:mono/diheme cytochrome c family protein
MIERYVSPEELRRLLSALLVAVIFICIVALFAFLIVPGMRNANQPIAGPPVDAPQGESGWLDVTEYPSAKGYTIPPVDPKTVMSPTPELLARGQALFDQNCLSCHGPAGHGDGPAARGLNPPPRNFSADAGWKNGYQIEGIWKTLQEGIKGSGMVAYEYLSKKDRMALVHYVQSLGSFDHGPEDPKKLEALAALFASSGEVVPNRIPVGMAMRKLEKEYESPLSPQGFAPAPALARWSIINPERAARTLAGIPAWRSDESALAQDVVRGVPGNGFAPAVATYTDGQWRELRTQLEGIYRP